MTFGCVLNVALFSNCHRMARVNYYALLTTKIDAELANLHHLKGLATVFLLSTK